MDAGRLHRLARALRQAALAATADQEDGRVSAAEVAVVEDLAHHPGATISGVVARTGLAQSQVSTTVASLRQAGIATAEADPADRRRALISLTPTVRDRLLRARAARPVDDGLLRVRPGASPDQILRVQVLLEEVADLLLDDGGATP